MSAAGLPVCLTRPPKLVLHPPPVSKSEIKPIPGFSSTCRKTTKKQAKKGKERGCVVSPHACPPRRPRPLGSSHAGCGVHSALQKHNPCLVCSPPPAPRTEFDSYFCMWGGQETAQLIGSSCASYKRGGSTARKQGRPQPLIQHPSRPTTMPTWADMTQVSPAAC